MITRLFAIALLFLPAQGFATVISFTDPVGDHTGAVDVTGMTLDFDAAGNYSIDITASAANRFNGDFRINVNLWNVTLDEFFQDVFNDFMLAAPASAIGLLGTDPLIADWLPGHTIVTSTYAGFGNPAGTSFFRSSVADIPFSPICDSEDVIGLDGCGIIQVPQVPLPAAAWLFGTALLGFVGIARRRFPG